MNNTTQQQQRQASKVIETIAKEILGLDTLETRKSDSLDFSDQAVWTLRTALEAAYIAGLAAATQSTVATAAATAPKAKKITASERAIVARFAENIR